MGILCCKKQQPPTSVVIETEPEVTVPTYSSNSDKEFNKLETTYNLLREITFNDYAYSLSKFSTENATLPDDYSAKSITYSKSDPYFKEKMSVELFQSFIENKIFKHPQVYTTAGNDETSATICKEALLEIHKALGKKLQQSDKEKGNSEDPDRVKKFHLMALGILYSSGSNVSKIKFIFDSFKENNRLVCSDDFKDFLLALCLIPAYCMLFARNKLGKNEIIGELQKETMKEILNTCELKDSLNLVEVSCKKIFSGAETGLGYDSFKYRFSDKDNGIGYLLTPKGVRKHLEINNV